MSNKPKLVNVQLVELNKRVEPFDTKLEIHNNGVDNNYPERIERMINNSATAKTCANLFRKYCLGKGFEGHNDFVINEKDGTNLYRFLYQVVDSFAYQNGAFIHVNWNVKHKITSLEVLPFKHCRVGKKDSDDYHSKIIIYDNWDGGKNGKVDKSKLIPIDVFNPKSKVIDEQIQHAKGINKYKGQIFYFNPSGYVYPLSKIDPVQFDVDSEYRTSVFKNLSLRQGFFGKKIFVTPPMLDDELNKPNELLTEDEVKEKKYVESARKKFREGIQDFVGVENVGGVYHMEVEFEGDDISKAINVVDVQTNINDKLFEYTENSIKNNIRKVFDNPPSILIEDSDSSIFGNSGEMIRQAKLFYQEQLEEARELIESQVINPLMKHFKDFTMPDDGLNIKELIDGVNNKTGVTE